MKGQISLDLLFAGLITVIVIGSFFVVTNNLRDNYESISVENQLKKVVGESAAFITSTKALEDLDFTTTIKVPKVIFGNKEIPIEFSVIGNELVGSVDIGEIIEKREIFSSPVGGTITFEPGVVIVSG